MSFHETPLNTQASASPAHPSAPAADTRNQVEDFPFDHPVKEARFQSAWTILRSTADPRARPNWWIFIIYVAFAAFLFLQGGKLDLVYLSLIVGVVVFHDLGHLLGMWYFGYTDTKIFLIPFLAALVTGKKHAAPAWQQAIVILLGPLPGLLLALGWYLTVRDTISSWELHLLALLIGMNVLNLLPFEPFDAGRLLNLILFSRNAWIESFMQIVATVIFAAVAYHMESHFLWMFAAFTLLSIPFRFRKGKMIARLRHEGLQMPDTVAELTPLHGRMLFAAAYDVMKNKAISDPIMANTMRELHSRVLVPAPGILGTVVFLLLYVLCLATGVGTVALMTHDIFQLQRERERYLGDKFNLALQTAQARTQANRLQGPARQAALDRLEQMEGRLQAMDERNREVTRKLVNYRSLFPAFNNDWGDPDELLQQDPQDPPPGKQRGKAP